jgi:hypothetical protein
MLGHKNFENDAALCKDLGFEGEFGHESAPLEVHQISEIE